MKRFELRDSEILYKGRVLSKEVANRIQANEKDSDVMETEDAVEPVLHSTPKKDNQQTNVIPAKSVVKDKIKLFSKLQLNLDLSVFLLFIVHCLVELRA